MADAQTSRELPVSFSSFIVSLATSAMMHMGEGPNPAGQQANVDLELARNTIDVLGVLRDKTEGNLDEDETKLLEALLYETRLKFMEKTKQG